MKAAAGAPPTENMYSANTLTKYDDYILDGIPRKTDIFS